MSTKDSCRGAEDLSLRAGSAAGAAQPAVQDRVGNEEEFKVFLSSISKVFFLFKGVEKLALFLKVSNYFKFSLVLEIS